MKKGSATENSNFIKEADYEKYQLVLPYRFLFGRKRQNYIYSELEKLHPCFSEEFCFDSNIRKLSKKGLVSDVLVIHKYTLAEYEAGRGARAGLIGGKIGSGFFVSSSKGHRFFKDVKVKKLFLFELIFFAIVLIFSLMLSISKMRYTEEEVLSEAKEILPLEDAIEPSFLIEDFIAGIKGLGGRILFFQWEGNRGYESLDARVKEVFPEELNKLGLENLNMGTVNYADGLPLIQLSLISKNPSLKVNAVSKSDKAVSYDFYQVNRKFLLDSGASLKEEKVNPYLLHFTCNKNVLRTLFSGLAENYRNAGVDILSVSISYVTGINGAGDFEISITGVESAAPAPGRGLALIGENADIFGEKKKSIPLSKLQPKENEIKEIKKEEIPDARKIGEIKNPEGKIIRFYKTSDGKIKKLMEE